MTDDVDRIKPPAWDRLVKSTRAHKYDHGHCLVASGGAGATGAARLAALAALRVGAGLVTLCAPGEAVAECAAQLTAIMLRRCDDAAAFADAIADARVTGLIVGPGHARSSMGPAATRAWVEVALARRVFTLLDADALTCWAHGGAELAELVHEQTVLTPHEGEFARLFPDLADNLAGLAIVDRAARVGEASVRCGATLLLKGPRTLVATPSGACAVLEPRASAAWLASAGSGDVLAGLIAGLGARGFAPFDAAKTGAWLHAAAAEICGPGLIAEDLPAALPAVFKALSAQRSLPSS